MTRILVIGSGLAGRTAVALLLKEKIKHNLKIKSLTWLNTSVMEDDVKLYTGLWTQSRNIAVTSGIIDEMVQNQYIKESGYRSITGQWLINPYRGMQAPPQSPNLSFFRNDYLLKRFDSDISKSIEVIKALSPVTMVEVKVGYTIDNITLSQEACFVTAKSNDNQYNVEADIIIAADGTYSNIRSLLFPHIANNILEDRGYTVFRGTTLKENLPKQILKDHLLSSIDQHPIAFQTWGDNKRFAVVPTEDGFAWFCAVSNHLLKFGDELYRRQYSQSPLWNNSFFLSNEQWRKAVRPLFDSWHQPIPHLLDNMDVNHHGVVATNAIAFKHDISNELIQSSNNQVFLIGDARHTFDPILAQGAGVAIEDAYHAVQMIKSALDKGGSFNKESRATLCAEFYKKRQSRTQRLHYLSNLSQSLGHMNSIPLITARDSILKMTPTFIKGRLFDYFIDLASGHKN